MKKMKKCGEEMAKERYGCRKSRGKRGIEHGEVGGGDCEGDKGKKKEGGGYNLVPCPHRPCCSESLLFS